MGLTLANYMNKRQVGTGKKGYDMDTEETKELLSDCSRSTWQERREANGERTQDSGPEAPEENPNFRTPEEA